MALIIGFKLQCTKSIIIYEHINLLSSLDLESLWPDVDGGCLASAMRNNFCVCIFDFPHVSARMPHNCILKIYSKTSQNPEDIFLKLWKKHITHHIKYILQ